MGVLFFVYNMIWGITLPLALQLLDRHHMSEEERERVWGFASWGSALYNFGPLSLVAWGYVTRSPRYVRGLALGCAMTAVALLAQGLLCEGFGRLIGLKMKHLEQNRVTLVATLGAAVLLALIVGLGRAIHEAVRGRRAPPGGVGRAPLSAG